MPTLLKFDEINRLESVMRELLLDKSIPQEKKRELAEDWVDDYLISAYLLGTEQASNRSKVKLTADDENLVSTINKKVGGKNFRERIREYVEQGDPDAINRVIETETTRVYNEAVLDGARRSEKPLLKRWETMKDNRVRETHSYIDGVEIPLNESFYTFDGDAALYPGGFERVENNANCRCWIDLVNA